MQKTIIKIGFFLGIVCSLRTITFAEWKDNINRNTVYSTITSRHNETRTGAKLAPYTNNSKLNTSAQKRADFLAANNITMHKRKPSDGYYNYFSIKSRFSDLGITFNTKTNYAFTENIARNYYSCTKTDCTADFLKALRKGYNFFLSEKGKKRQPHYKAVVAPGFSQIGIGIGRNAKSKKYFLVTHYSVPLLN